MIWMMFGRNKALKAWIPVQDDYGLEGCSEKRPQGLDYCSR